MQSLSRSKLNQLAIELRELPNQFPTAEDQIKNGLLEFADKLLGEDIAITKHSITGNKYVLGKKPMLNIFSEQFDPILNELYPEHSIGYKFRCNCGLLSLKNALTNQTVNALSQALTKPIGDLDNDDKAFDTSSDNTNEKKIGDTFYLIQSILLTIDKVYKNSKNSTEWCRSCFRRALKDNKYCEFHNSSKDDTAYKKGKVILENLDKKNRIKPRIYHRSIRAYLDANGSKGFSELQEIFEEDINNKDIWLRIRTEFIETFKSALPSVSFVLENSMNEQADSWDDFVTSVYLGLGDKIEKSTLPLNFILYIGNAEIWLKQESMLIDKRQSNTKKQVIELIKKKATRTEISIILDISRQRISQIFKEIAKDNVKNKKI